MKTKILVLCTGNSCRSQMAHGYLQYFGKDKVEVYSAGFDTHGINPKAVSIMKEDNIDISHHTSDDISKYENQHFDLVLTVCDNAKESCPVFQNTTKIIHHSFFDPSFVKGTNEEITNAFRKTRNEIKEFCKEIIKNTVTSNLA
jgi:arsenate reductase